MRRPVVIGLSVAIAYSNLGMLPRIIIIGGGPAGSVTAAYLAGAGFPTRLIEQHAFPRDKVCGECLGDLGFSVLQRLGLADRLLQAGAVRLDRTILHAGDGQSVQMALPRSSYGVSRSVLDTALLEHARACGARIDQPARCEGIDGRHVTVRDLRTNVCTTQPGDYILLADGKSILEPRPPATGDMGLKAHFAQVDGPRDAVELFAVNGHYVGLSPVEGQRWNLAMSIPQARLRGAHGDLDRVVDRILRENVRLAQRLHRAVRVSRWLTSPLPRFGIDSRRWEDGIIPLGNAAAAIEPIGGEGMAVALRSAEIAAEAIIACHAQDGAQRRTYAGHRVRFADLAPGFERLWSRRRLASRAAARILSSPLAASAALSLADSNTPLQWALLRLIGK